MQGGRRVTVQTVYGTLGESAKEKPRKNTVEAYEHLKNDSGNQKCITASLIHDTEYGFCYILTDSI